MRSIVGLIKNLKVVKNLGFGFLTGLCIASVSVSILAADIRYHQLPEKDLNLMLETLQGRDGSDRENMVLRIRWAGIADERLLDPLVVSMKSRHTSTAVARDHTRAVLYSGNVKYKNAIESLRQPGAQNKSSHQTARKEYGELRRYIANTNAMNQHTVYSDSDQFWLERFKIALGTRDVTRMRFASRDLTLFEYNETLFDYAEAFLIENQGITDDGNFINGLSYICTALGRSGEAKYQPTLIDLANNATNEKLAKYARAAVMMTDKNFKSTNPIL